MVYLWTGKTGSGKSTRMVKRAFKRYRQGENICTNINLFFYFLKGYSYFEYGAWLVKKLVYWILKLKQPVLKRGQIIRFELLEEIQDFRNGTIVFDDAGVLFNSKSWESIPIEFVHKLMLSRHHKLDLFATVPNIQSIHIDYRRLVQKWYYCKRIFGIGKSYCLFGLFIEYEKDIDYIDREKEDALAPEQEGILTTRIFFINLFTRRLYDTFADIAFRRNRVIWLNGSEGRRVWIIRKEDSLSQAQAKMFSMKKALGMIKSKSQA